jgi:hypothetical protein
MRTLLGKASAAVLVCWTSFAWGSPSSLPVDRPQSNTEVVSRVTVRGAEPREYDWAKLQARGRVDYVSSGPTTLRGRMIDNDLQTVFRFSASDTSPTVIVELAQAQRLNRISAVFKAEQAKLDIFLLDKVPPNARDLNAAQPFASIANTGQNPGQASFNFSPNSARYVALRWTRIRSNEPFEVAEISAFSDEPANLEFENPGHLADANGTSSGGFVTEPPTIIVASP